MTAPPFGKVTLWQWIQIAVWIIGIGTVVYVAGGDRSNAFARIIALETRAEVAEARDTAIQQQLNDIQKTNAQYFSEIKTDIRWIRQSLPGVSSREQRDHSP